MKFWRGSRRKLVLLITIIFIFSGCGEDENKKRYFVSADSYILLQKNTLKAFLQASGLDISEDEIRYDVEVFKFVYNTEYKGESIQASGLVVLPATSDPVSMISFQHGTISAHEDAPSLTPTSNEVLFLYAALASPGFIVVIPDFVGFGASEEIMHPYYVEEVTASAIIDNLRAAKEFAKKNDVSFNENLFLAGYSQGGYATMATHKSIEENGLQGFNLVASFPASGGYDIQAMRKHFFAQDTYHEPFYLAYVARAYQTYYDWTAPLGDFFNEPYASRIPNLFNGSFSGSQINDQLTDDISTLINPDLLQNIDSDTQYSYIVDAFDENSLVDWTPAIDMYMYHGDADITVPYQNSVDVYDQLIANGASPSVVRFITLPGADHGSGVLPYIENFIPKLLAY